MQHKNTTMKLGLMSLVGISGLDHHLQSSELPRSRHLWHLPQAIAGGVGLGLAVATALFYLVAHGSLASITVGGVPVRATASPAQLHQQIAAATKAYKLRVKYPDGSIKSFSLADTGVSVDANKSALQAKQSINHAMLRRLQWWRPIHLDLAVKTNPIKLQYFIDNSVTTIKVPPQDAGLSLNGGVVTVTQEAQGEGHTVLAARLIVPDQVAGLETKPLVLESAKLKASITAKDLTSSQAKAQSLINQSVTFTIAGHTVTPSAADVAGWLDLSPVRSSKTIDVTVDSGKVLQYINAIARRYISQPRSRLVVNTSDGQVVLDPGANGVDVINKDQAAANVAKQLLGGHGVNVELPVQYAAAQTVEAQPYDKWFVADTTNKRMYAYEGTTLVRSFLISAGAPATPTVTGTFRIYAKYASQDMSGNNADGSRYFQPAVPYVNYFYGGYAIHGNYWRPASWFGNINSSHGCIGVTVADGEWIYNWATLGTVVVVHR